MPAKKAAPRKSRKTTKKRPAKRTPKQRRPETKPAPKKRRLPSLPLLILECDANRLEREGMAMGDQLHKIAQGSWVEKSAHSFRSRSEAIERVQR